MSRKSTQGVPTAKTKLESRQLTERSYFDFRNSLNRKTNIYSLRNNAVQIGPVSGQKKPAASLQNTGKPRDPALIAIRNETKEPRNRSGSRIPSRANKRDENSPSLSKKKNNRFTSIKNNGVSKVWTILKRMTKNRYQIVMTTSKNPYQNWMAKVQSGH